MKLLLDTAKISLIREILPYMPIVGFTTNPSILAKESEDVKKTVEQLIELSEGHRMIHIQMTAVMAEDILRQAKAVQAIVGENFYAKIPMTMQGLRAVTLCKAEGIHTTMTAIFTPMQALLAAEAGADFVAPYVDRLDNITSNGVNVVREIVDLFEIYHLPTQVLAASFKNVQQVYNAASMGAHAATLNGELCLKLLFHPYTDKSLEDFDFDWRGRFGDREIDELLCERQEGVK